MLLGRPSFFRLWVGNVSAGAATAAMPVLLALAVLASRGSVGLLGFVLAAHTTGFVVAAPAAGVFADRFSRRRVIRFAALAATMGTAAVAWLLTAGIWVLVAGFLAGAGQGAYRPAYQAGLADVVDDDHRQAANALSTLGARVAGVVAPALAAGASHALGARCALALCSTLWLVPFAAPSVAAGAGDAHASLRNLDVLAALAGDVSAGAREARKHPWFLAGLAALAVQLSTGYAVTAVVLPQVSRDRFGGDVVLASALTAYTVGALLSAACLTRWRPRNDGWVALGGMALYASVPLTLAVPVSPWALFVAYLAAGIGVELFNVPWFTAVQREVPAALLARVSSVDFVVSYGLSPVGIALLIPAEGVVGRTVVLLVCGVACLLAPVAAASASGARHFSRVDRPAAGSER